MYDSDNNRQITKLFNVTTSWTKHVINFPADTSTDDDFNYDNDSSLFLILRDSQIQLFTLNTSLGMILHQQIDCWYKIRFLFR